MGAFGWPHLLVLLAIVLLVFGAAKLPALAKSVGQSARVFKGEMKAMKEDDAAATTSAPATTTAPAVGTGTSASVAETAPSPSSTPDTKP